MKVRLIAIILLILSVGFFAGCEVADDGKTSLKYVISGNSPLIYISDSATTYRGLVDGTDYTYTNNAQGPSLSLTIYKDEGTTSNLSVTVYADDVEVLSSGTSTTAWEKFTVSYSGITGTGSITNRAGTVLSSVK